MGESYQGIHQKAMLIDTHNDILSLCLEKDLFFDADLTGKSHSDLRRWKAGGLNAQLFVVWCDEINKKPFDYAVKQLDLFDLIVKRNQDRLIKVADSTALLKTVNEDKIAGMLAIEGGHMIENDLNKLEYFYDRGARYMTLTWNNSTDWASSSFDESSNPDLKQKGLSKFGKQVIKRMNLLGMMVDVSHAGEQTFWDVLETSTKPVFASHSNVYSLCPNHRNLKDEQIKAIAEQGGTIHVNFYSAFLDKSFMKKKDDFIADHKTEFEELLKKGMVDYMAEDLLINNYPSESEKLRAPFSLLIEHIEYLVNLVGIDHVGIGSDFDGINSSAIGLDDVTCYPLITKALVEKGFSEKAILKIYTENFLRVLKANENE
jgi:membrane dipeptidase